MLDVRPTTAATPASRRPSGARHRSPGAAAEAPATAAAPPRRTSYDGFRATIKAVGSGERGRRDLDRDEARDAVRAILDGAASEAQTGAFLLALRVKGETPAELAGVADALRERATRLEPRTDRTLVACAGGYDGCAEAPSLALAAAVVAAAAGAGVVVHCGGTLGPKRGTTPADVLGALGGPRRPTPAQSEAMLERAGATVVHASASLDGWDALARVRDEIGVRGALHSAEKLVDWFGARRLLVGYAHGSYAERLCAALAVLGAERAYAVRGPEGADVPRPDRPSAHRDGLRLDLPDGTADHLAPAPGAEAGALLTRAVVAGTADHAVTTAVALGAAIRLHACGVVATVPGGVAAARSAIADGRASRTLAALVG